MHGLNAKSETSACVVLFWFPISDMGTRSRGTRNVGLNAWVRSRQALHRVKGELEGGKEDYIQYLPQRLKLQKHANNCE